MCDPAAAIRAAWGPHHTLVGWQHAWVGTGPGIQLFPFVLSPTVQPLWDLYQKETQKPYFGIHFGFLGILKGNVSYAVSNAPRGL